MSVVNAGALTTVPTITKIKNDTENTSAEINQDVESKIVSVSWNIFLTKAASIAVRRIPSF
jgi:hypothetical protein